MQIDFEINVLVVPLNWFRCWANTPVKQYSVWLQKFAFVSFQFEVENLV